MGLRGPGAKPIAGRGAKAKKLRQRLPWQKKGLSRAERVIAFCEDLTITSGTLAGSKMKLRPWQREFIEAVYREDDEGNRPVRTAVLSLARKNGKSQLAAALALCHLAGPESESRGEVYACANDRFQAGKIFSEMVAFIGEHAEIAERLNIRRFNKDIEVLEGDGKGSIFAALSADAATKLGLSPSFVVYDELGAAPKRDLYDAMDTAMGARANPLMVVISTQAADDHAPLSELIDYGLKVQAGEVVDPAFHLTLYAAPNDADPWSPETWALANPALGDFRSLEDVERQAAQAQRVRSKANAFKNLICNMRIAAHERFVDVDEWKANGDEPEEVAGRPCFAGLDLGATRDLTALVLAFPAPDGTVDVIPHFFMPADGLKERAALDRVPYDQWAERGQLITMPGATNDPAFVARVIAEAAAQYELKAVAFDRWRIEDLRRELRALGAEVELVPHGQGFKDMSPAVDVLERHVAERRLRHGMHPVLTMCALNAVVTLDAAGNRKLDKAKATGRIDGLIALTMALSIAERIEPEPEIEFDADNMVIAL